MYKLEAAGALDETAIPGVITGNMLIALAVEQGPENEAGRLFLKDGIELNKLKEIRIEFLNILNIDYLWLLKDLVKLSLSHNVIEVIDNLDELVHLRELDLSFNRIKVMANLNHLSELEILLLYSNEITIVEDIDNLKKLIILNVGQNKIADWKHVTYLRDFKALRSLNTCDNPCTEMDGYLDYLFAFVPQLLYYQYRMITEDVRRAAINKHYRAISTLEENEAKIQAELILEKELEDKTALLLLSYVEYLDEDCLFQRMFSLDSDGRMLSLINEDTQKTFEEYRKSFSKICNKLCEVGLEEHNKRLEEIRLFEVAVNGGKESTQNKARRIIDEILEKKVEIFADVKTLMKAMVEEEEAEDAEEADGKAAKATGLLDEFNELLFKARAQLMSKEVVLHDQIEDINETFKHNITDMVSSFVRNARMCFSDLRNAEAEYNDSINGLALCYLSSLEDDASIPAHLAAICGDKDTLAKTLAASHDAHLHVIDDREDRLMNRLDDWVEEYTAQLVVDENRRNRQQILEISHFFGSQKQELGQLGLPQPAGLEDIDLDIDDLND